ncbi:Uncharacterized protein APZ42_023891 [Daphnia magna]|uniref:Uncharacterized protein n=1 Tax=Daphnia magna TaxID=35525 RepID=A0A0P5X4D9_9CRUS|nr:Uncharacterized protein APZ42_023891 [Daphnia magna]
MARDNFYTIPLKHTIEEEEEEKKERNTISYMHLLADGVMKLHFSIPLLERVNSICNKTMLDSVVRQMWVIDGTCSILPSGASYT